MKIEQASLKPIYLQIAEGIEDEILSGLLNVDEQAYSQNHIAARHKVNPATAAKGLNLLVDEGILYRKRGLGMYVSTEAKSIIQVKRKNHFKEDMLAMVLREAHKLGIGREELKAMIDNMGGEPSNDRSNAD